MASPTCTIALLALLGIGRLEATGLRAQQPTSRPASQPTLAALGAATAAKIAGSAVFVSGRSPESVLADEFTTEDPIGEWLTPLLKLIADRQAKTMTATVLGHPCTAVFRPGFGCTLVFGDTPPHDVPSLPGPTTANSRPSPTTHGDRITPGDRALEAAVDAAFAGHADGHNPRTRAVVIVHHGQIVAERYAPGFSASTRLHGWSMTKSVADALIGIRVRQGLLDLDSTAVLPSWYATTDPRRAITADHLLRMSAGLAWNEDYKTLYADPSLMLFGTADAAAFAAECALVHAPGTHWQYSSGTTNILSRMLRATFEQQSDYLEFPRRELFEPLGMASAIIEPDPSGTFIASSMMFATARDWARFGMLYLADGVWGDRRVLPSGWVATSTSPAPHVPRGRYGRHWWLNAGSGDRGDDRVFPELPRDLFYAAGFEGQVLAILPSKQCVAVRLGCTKHGPAFRIGRFIRDVLAALPNK